MGGTVDEYLGQNITDTLVAGVPLLLKQIQPNRPVVVKLIFQGGVSLYESGQDGVEGLTLASVLGGSTQDYSANNIRQQLATLGTDEEINVGLAYTTVTMKCLPKNFEASFLVFMNQLFGPSFEEAELEVIRKNYLGSLKTLSPEDPALFVARKAMFGSQWPNRLPVGDSLRLMQFSPDSLRAHYSRMLRPGKVKLVIVGAVNMSWVATSLIQNFGQLTSQPPNLGALPAINLSEKPILQPDPSKVGTIVGFFDAPAMGTPEATATAAARSLLEDRLLAELCARPQLSCTIATAQLPFTPGYGYITVLAPTPNPTIKALLAVCDELKAEGYTQRELAEKKAELLTRYYSLLQSSGGQAEVLAQAFAQGSWRAALAESGRIKNLNLVDVNQANTRLLQGIHWVYVGDVDQVGLGVFAAPGKKRK